ncbi:hypothetical protein BDB00DRAFT_56576 [Zychaea mexicana]|uniref:uncharacterized protein n=1 Tax=Zychaea mexicana TaxID=64656 RepID=UPI0022FF06DF|nr:uncharacterized protein BDB00DRAFT_56576 [Zychaea mexicana]KAI9488307.1 hypothetical protein BDB00DRAFT_56576 [Zychaea mexicana]
MCAVVMVMMLMMEPQKQYCCCSLMYAVAVAEMQDFVKLICRVVQLPFEPMTVVQMPAFSSPCFSLLRVQEGMLKKTAVSYHRQHLFWPDYFGLQDSVAQMYVVEIVDLTVRAMGSQPLVLSFRFPVFFSKARLDIMQLEGGDTLLSDLIRKRSKKRKCMFINQQTDFFQ